MEARMELLQDLQDAYAALCGMSLLIKGPQGEPLTRVSGSADPDTMTHLAEQVQAGADGGYGIWTAERPEQAGASGKAQIHLRRMAEIIAALLSTPSASLQLSTQSVTAGSTSLDEWVQLSSREKQVLELVVEGLTNREIAERLFISDHTVKNHITKLFSKLGVTDRVQVIAKVYQQGYVSAQKKGSP